MSGVSAYLMLMDGESLRRIGKGSGLDLVAAAKSWIARHALCAPPGWKGKGWRGWPWLAMVGPMGLENGARSGMKCFSDG